MKLMKILFERELNNQIISYEIEGGKLDGETGKGTFRGIINFFKINGIKIYDLIKTQHLKNLAQGLPIEIKYFKTKIILKKEPEIAKIF